MARSHLTRREALRLRRQNRQLFGRHRVQGLYQFRIFDVGTSGPRRSHCATGREKPKVDAQAGGGSVALDAAARDAELLEPSDEARDDRNRESLR